MIMIVWILWILPYNSENWDETGYKVWKIEIDNATKYTTCYSNSKAGTIINESNIMMHLNLSTVRLYQTYKTLLEKTPTGFLIQLPITLLMFQSIIPWLAAAILFYQIYYTKKSFD